MPSIQSASLLKNNPLNPSAPSPENLRPEVAAQVEDQLNDALEAAKTARHTTEAAEKTRERAAVASSNEERTALEKEADELDAKAAEQVKLARRLQSGAWQGAGIGAGMGAVSAMGVGGVLGTIVGGVAAIPATMLGGLIGAGVGAAKGAWIKVGRKEKAVREELGDDVSDLKELEFLRDDDEPKEKEAQD